MSISSLFGFAILLTVPANSLLAGNAAASAGADIANPHDRPGLRRGEFHTLAATLSLDAPLKPCRTLFEAASKSRARPWPIRSIVPPKQDATVSPNPTRSRQIPPIPALSHVRSSDLSFEHRICPGTGAHFRVRCSKLSCVWSFAAS